MTEHRELEQQLRQSQKMEAIGLLAGGVAHDFNNILAVILMQTESMQESRELPTAVQKGLQQLQTATERAADLTRQLLLFGRKQLLQPRDLDLNAVVASFARMLQRILGEDVRLELHLHPARLLTRADAGMLEQVLMNLAVNARDAMPGGGSLRIQTAEQVVVDDARARLIPTRRRAATSASRSATPAPASRRRICRTSSSRSSPPRDPARGRGWGSRPCSES